MFRILSFYLFCTLTFSLSAQTEEDDNTYVDEEGHLRNKPLNGTVILPYTHNYFSVLGSGYVAYKVEKADCSDHGERVYSEQDKIDQVIFSDSLIEIHMRIYDNCCYDFLWDPYLSSEGILDLKYIGYGSHCGCNCCFGHVIKFRKEYEPDDKIDIKEICINGEGAYKVK